MSKTGFWLFILLFTGLVLAYYAGAVQLLNSVFGGTVKIAQVATNRDSNGQLIGYAKGYSPL